MLSPGGMKILKLLSSWMKTLMPTFCVIIWLNDNIDIIIWLNETTDVNIGCYHLAGL
jgi:hypothetical protein